MAISETKLLHCQNDQLHAPDRT